MKNISLSLFFLAAPAAAVNISARALPAASSVRYMPPAFMPVPATLAGGMSQLMLSGPVNIAGHPQLSALAAVRPDSDLDLAAMAPLAAALEASRPGFAADLTAALAAAEPQQLDLLRTEVIFAIREAAPKAELEVQRRVGEIAAQYRAGKLKPHELEEAAQQLSAFAYYGKGARDAAGLARAFARQVTRETVGLRGDRARHAIARSALTAQQMTEMGGRAAAILEAQEDATYSAEDKALASQAAAGAIISPFAVISGREETGDIDAAAAAAAWHESQAGAAASAPLPINASLDGLIRMARQDSEAAPSLARRLSRLRRSVTGKAKAERVEFGEVGAAVSAGKVPISVLRDLARTPGVRTEVLTSVVAALAPRGHATLAQYTEPMAVVGKAMSLAIAVGIVMVAAAALSVIVFGASAAATFPFAAAGTLIALAGMTFGPNMERARVEKAARQGPEALLARLKADVPYFAAAFSKSIGVREGYTLEEHTLMVMRQHQRYSPTADPVTLLTLALHDIGDTEIGTEDMPPSPERSAAEAEQHARTIEVLRGYLGALGYPAPAVARAEATLSVDLGLYMNPANGGTVAQTVAAVRAGAAKAGLPAREFFLEHALPYYMADIAAYTRDAGGFASLDSMLVFDAAGGRLSFSPAARDRMIPLAGRLIAVTENLTDVFSRQSSIDDWMSSGVFTALAGGKADLSLREQLVFAAFAGFREDGAAVRAGFEAANPDLSPGSAMARLARETHQAYLASVTSKPDGTPNPDHENYTQPIHDALFALVVKGALSFKGKAVTPEQFEQWDQKYKFKLSDVAEAEREGFQTAITAAIGRPMSETMVLNTVAGEWDALSHIQARGPAAETWLNRRGDYLYGLQAESVGAIISAMHDPVLLARLGSRSRAERRLALVELMRIVNDAWRVNNAWHGRDYHLLSKPFDTAERGGIGVDEILKDTFVLERIASVVDGALRALHAGHAGGALVLPSPVRAGLSRAFSRGLMQDLEALKQEPQLEAEVERSGRVHRAPFSIPERLRLVVGL